LTGTTYVLGFIKACAWWEKCQNLASLFQKSPVFKRVQTNGGPTFEYTRSWLDVLKSNKAPTLKKFQGHG
jgi:hypothetical protein